MIKIAVCDDEPEMLAVLRTKIQAEMDGRGLFYEIALFESGEALLASGETFALVFLDVQMKGLTGIETARKLRACGKKSAIIFVTVLHETVYDAFEVEATDYLLKPIDEARLKGSLDRALRYVRQGRKKRLLIRSAGQCRSIKLEDIICCEVINRKVTVYTIGEAMEYYCRIEELEKQLDGDFFRCHRSYLVHLGHVSRYANGEAVMDNGQRLPVSRLRGQDFTRAILRYLKDGGG